MNRLIERTMKKSILILTLIVLILSWGGVSAFQMQREYLPSINNTAIVVTVQADHFQSDQVKQYVTMKMEEAVQAVDQLENIETNSFDGGLMASFYFNTHADMEKAERDLKTAIYEIRLPEGVKKPLVTRVSTNSFPIMRLSLTANGADEKKLRSSIQEKVAHEIKRTPGVREVRVTGAGNEGYIVKLKPEMMDKMQLTTGDIKKALSDMYPVWPQGMIKDTGAGKNQVILPIRVTDWKINNKELEEVKIPLKNGKSATLGEVAEIAEGIVDMQTISRTSGKPSVLLDIYQSPSSNITEVTKKVYERIKQIPAIKTNSIQLAVLLDQGKEVNEALSGLIKEGLLGIFFSVAFVFAFFRNVRSTMIIAISLPICLLAAIAILKTMDISLNILTISGLIVAMGRVVDDSIIVLDNMLRKQQNFKDGSMTARQLAKGASEMIPAIVASTATTIAVFLPISLIGGMISSAFSGFAWSVVMALVISLGVAVMVVPALAFLLLKNQQTMKPMELERKSQHLLQSIFPKRKVIVIITLGLFAMTIIKASLMPVNFLPRGNSGGLNIHVELPDSAPLADVDAEVKNIETILKNNPQVAGFSSTLGSSFSPVFDDVFDEGGGWIQKQTVANLSVSMKKGTSLDVAAKELRNQLTVLSSSAVYTVSNQNISGDDSRLKVLLTGDNQQELTQAAILTRSKLQMIPGLSIEGTANDGDMPMKHYLSLNQQKITQKGMNVAEILNRVNSYLSVEERIDVSAGDNKVPVVLKMDSGKNRTMSKDADPERTILSTLGHEMFAAKDGSKVSLAEIASLKTSTQTVISEQDGHAFATVAGNITGRDIGEITKKVNETMKELSLPDGVHYSIGGISKQVKQMVMEMSLVFALSFLLVLVIVSTMFRSWQAPFAVLMCLPLAFIGSVWSMSLVGAEWNLSALIGLLMLTGIVVTNGIVLVDKIERNLADGMDTQEAILAGTSSRVRPILLTAGTTILTLLPLATSDSSNAIVSQTLGLVVVGGMISSTLISLIVIPIVYDWLKERAKVKVYPEDTTSSWIKTNLP